MYLINEHPCFFLSWILKLNFSGWGRVDSCAGAWTQQKLALQHPLLETRAAFPSEQRKHTMIDTSSPYIAFSQSLPDGELLRVALKGCARTGNLANIMEHAGFQGDPLPSDG